eukprot:TRINITY_DN5258_c0_g1_i1.p1 TRINITY_DN5258_c0_g1~~TRINITY_DN5258_c0_g1_i1.p1  ORF type:complete len:311 (-),score=83.17 TRINITY_DN5258_c0_g1_i1:47-979(-)
MSTENTSTADNTNSNDDIKAFSKEQNHSGATINETPSTPIHHGEDPAESSGGHGEHGNYTAVKSVGVSTEKNPKFRKTMEDAHVIADGFGGDKTSAYFAVYDGHGGRGAVDFTEKELHQILLKTLKEKGDAREALKEAYLEVDRQMTDQKISAGTTAVSALIRVEGAERVLYVANAGDARGVLGRAGGKAERLSYDHKGSDESEARRITEAGGYVILNRVNGILAVTRSLGDISMKEFVTGEPYMTRTVLESTDTHLILACDGLWDVVSDEEAIEMVVGETDAQALSEKLLQQALKRGSTDNISILVVVL